MHEDDAFVEAGLVVTIQVRKVDLQPPKTTLTKGLSLSELEKATT